MLLGVALADVDEGARQALLERFSDCVDRLLEQVGLCGCIRMPLRWFFVDGKLKEAMTERAEIQRSQRPTGDNAFPYFRFSSCLTAIPIVSIM
jgi:hypothetical protein